MPIIDENRLTDALVSALAPEPNDGVMTAAAGIAAAIVAEVQPALDELEAQIALNAAAIDAIAAAAEAPADPPA